MTRMKERQKEEEYKQHKEQEENKIRQCKREGGNIITRRLRNWSSCRVIEGKKVMCGLGEKCKNMRQICARRIKVMDGRMDGWMDGWMDRWMEGWIDGWKDGWMDGWLDGWIDGWVDGWMDGWMDG